MAVNPGQTHPDGQSGQPVGPVPDAAVLPGPAATPAGGPDAGAVPGAAAVPGGDPGTAPAAGRRPRLLLPGLWLTERLRTSTRLAVLVLILVVPGVVASGGFVDVTGSQINFSRQERTGVEVLRPALTALATMVAGDTPDLAAVQRAVTANPQFDLAEQAGAVGTAAPDGGAGRRALAGALAALITEIGNSSNLILDPDLDSFYVMDIQVVQLPRALLAAIAASAPSARAGSEELVAEQAVNAGALSGAGAALRSDADTAAGNTSLAGLGSRISAVDEAAKAAEAMSATLLRQLDDPVPPDPSGVGAAAAKAVDGLAAALTELLDARIGLRTREQRLVLAVFAGGLLAAGWVAAAVWWRTRRDVGQVLTAMTAIAGGDLAPQALPAGRDEFGDIGRALAATRARLSDNDDSLRQAQAERVASMRSSFVQQQQAESQVRQRAQQAVESTATTVLDELSGIVSRIDDIRVAASTIDEQVLAADRVTRAVVERSGGAAKVASDAEQSLHQVARMAVLVSNVAAQTRMLALNATIEAARAGAAGMGFTVVANEVKDLAMATARSTAQITETIASLETDMAAMSSTITGMQDGIGGMDQATAGLRTIATEQHTLVEQLNQAVCDVMGRIGRMAADTGDLERRTEGRVPHEGTVWLSPASGTAAGGPPAQARLLDISRGGLRCTAAPPVAARPGDRLEVGLALAGVTETIAATVARRVDGEDAVELGLHFDALSPRMAAGITAMVDDLTAAARG